MQGVVRQGAGQERDFKIKKIARQSHVTASEGTRLLGVLFVRQTATLRQPRLPSMLVTPFLTQPLFFDHPVYPCPSQRHLT